MILQCILVLLSCLIAIGAEGKEIVLDTVPIDLENAIDSDKRTWGLMQRTSLPLDYGMLFSFKHKTAISLWSFNCYMDLAVAFLDKEGTIQEITLLKAYPEMMDPNRPVLTINDLKLYPPGDPIIRFYTSHAVKSKRPCYHALETESTFFKRNQLSVGDRLFWNDPSSQAFFKRI